MRAMPAYPQTKVTREDWLAAALDTLIERGVEQVKVLTLAQRLQVSRSSFYWYFKGRQDLLDQLLQKSQANTANIVARAEAPAAGIVEGVLNIFDCWVDPALFDPRLDFAIREWARRSRSIRKAVDREDATRVAALKSLFQRHGYAEADAFVRARVLYFTQLGYYALDLKETPAERLALVVPYLRAFTGEDPAASAVEHFVARSRAMVQR